MPKEKEGVGLARKIAMDEAARILNPEGIIICLDADCTVEANYIREICNSFQKKPDMEAASIYFEHVLDELDDHARNNIVSYELHLRYLVHAHRWCGHPFAYHTVGSSMAVGRNAYLRQGGMNTRRAGEDFYFLHKFIENDKLFEIKSTTVYPSARMSDRVPFGTGRAMLELGEGKKRQLTTNFEIFKKIRPLFASLHLIRKMVTNKSNTFNYHELAELVGLDLQIIKYLEAIEFGKTVMEIFQHTNSLPSFQKRFFRYFNAFRMIRYTHYMRDHFYTDVAVGTAATELLAHKGITQHFHNSEELLHYFRKMDKTDSVAGSI